MGMEQDISAVKGVGEKKAAALHDIGIQTVHDLLFYFPYRYEDRRVRPLSEAVHEEVITVEGVVERAANVRFYGKKKSRLTFPVRIDYELVQAVMFNRHFAKKQLPPGKTVRLTGKWNQYRRQITVIEYSIGSASADESELQPVYSTTSAVSISFLQKIIRQALDDFAPFIAEIIPGRICERYQLPSRLEALRSMHMPRDASELKHAKRRFIYEEFLLFQLHMLLRKKVNETEKNGFGVAYSEQHVRQLIRGLPFSLTVDQREALKEILADMQRSVPMNRLLQGDVGSGKTVVAALAMYAAFTGGYQSALMVPTEILAEQHYQSIAHLFRDTPIQIGLLTGSTSLKKRRDLLAGLQFGTIDMLIGTHALIQGDVHFKQLGLVVTDEQHRFGVAQRRKLRQKGMFPHMLFMTATPIPRTLAITAFGDLDVSIIQEMPKGRKKIKTYWVKENVFPRVVQFIGKEAAQKRQTFFIAPLIEESEKMDVQNVLDIHQRLQKLLPTLRIGLLHGKMNTEQRENEMKQFASGNTDVLVATTVIEVGVDVPNASLMIIQDAERFGLAQLHQLRGRVGRGNVQAYCILIADPKSEEAKERMRIMQSTSDGFDLARRDLQMRGPGEFFGKRQSGLPSFKVGDMIQDYNVMETARKDALHLLNDSVQWGSETYEPLRKALEQQKKEDGKLD